MKKEVVYKKEISKVSSLPDSQFRESYQALISLLVHSYEEVS